MVNPARTYASAEIPFSEEMLPLVAAKGASVVLPLDRPLVETVVAPAMVSLPVHKGQKLGEIRVMDNGKLVARRALVAAEDVEAPGLAEKAGWYSGHALSEAGDTISNLFGSIF